MSLDIALSNAVSGLRAAQTEIQVTSNNVSNAQTPGYTRKIISTLSVVAGAQGAGVTVSSITRNVIQGLVNEVNNQTTTQAFSQALTDILNQFQDSSGDPSSATSIGNQVASMASAFQALATTPSGVPQKTQLVAAAQQFTRSLNGLVQTIQSLRTNADSELAQAVSDANTQLTTIQGLNGQIVKAQALGQSTADLQDQRDLAVNQLAAEMNITTNQQSDGSINVYTTTGQLLLSGEGAAPTLTHNAVGSASPSLVYPGGIDGIKLNGVDITTSITGGKIGALVQLRDTTLPNVNSQLDNLATATATQINALHNTGAGVPATNVLTGSLGGLTAATAFAGTGTVRIAVTDQNGNAVAVPLDLNLATVVPATVGGLITVINTGLGANGTASLNAAGQLVITATSASNGIAINQESTNTNASGKGFSSYFGLNDLFVFGVSSSPAQTIAVRSDIVANPNLVSTGTVSTAALAAGASAIAPGDNSVIQKMANAFNSNVAFAAAGGLPATTTTLADYGSQIVSAAANQASNAKSDASLQQTILQTLNNQASSASGVNSDEELANLTVLQNAYAASARVVTVVNQLFQVLQQMGQ